MNLGSAHINKCTLFVHVIVHPTHLMAHSKHVHYYSLY